MVMRSKIITSAYIVLIGITVFSSYGYFAGITGRTKKGGFTEGCKCHGSSPFNNVTVTISGPDTVYTGQTANFLLSISGGPLLRGGTNIAASAGDLNEVSGSGLRKQDGELTHQQPKMPVSGSVSFQFSYTAPSFEGIDTIFANGNSVSNDTLPFNDNWNFADNKKIVVKNPIGISNISGEIPTGYVLEQNFPNPFNPVTKIRFSVPEASDVNLKFFDCSGRELKELINLKLNAGKYVYELDASGFSSGIYFYRLKAGGFTETRKMILLK